MIPREVRRCRFWATEHAEVAATEIRAALAEVNRAAPATTAAAAFSCRRAAGVVRIDLYTAWRPSHDADTRAPAYLKSMRTGRIEDNDRNWRVGLLQPARRPGSHIHAGPPHQQSREAEAHSIK